MHKSRRIFEWFFTPFLGFFHGFRHARTSDKWWGYTEHLPCASKFTTINLERMRRNADGARIAGFTIRVKPWQLDVNLITLWAGFYRIVSDVCQVWAEAGLADELADDDAGSLLYELEGLVEQDFGWVVGVEAADELDGGVDEVLYGVADEDWIGVGAWYDERGEQQCEGTHGKKRTGDGI